MVTERLLFRPAEESQPAFDLTDAARIGVVSKITATSHHSKIALRVNDY
jgi:hypothetical protein